MAQGSGAAPAVRLAAGGPIACPTRFPSIARPLPAIGGQFSVPMVAPGPEMQGHGGAPSCSWRAPGFGAGSCGALRPSQDGAGRGSLLRGGARAHGWLLRNGFQAAQGGDRPLHGEGAGVCGGKGVGCVRARPCGPWPQDPPGQASMRTQLPCALLLGSTVALPTDGAHEGQQDRLGSAWGWGQHRAPLPGTRLFSVPNYGGSMGTERTG